MANNQFSVSPGSWHSQAANRRIAFDGIALADSEVEWSEGGTGLVIDDAAPAAPADGWHRLYLCGKADGSGSTLIITGSAAPQDGAADFFAWSDAIAAGYTDSDRWIKVLSFLADSGSILEMFNYEHDTERFKFAQFTGRASAIDIGTTLVPLAAAAPPWSLALITVRVTDGGVASPVWMKIFDVGRSGGFPTVVDFDMEIETNEPQSMRVEALLDGDAEVSFSCDQINGIDVLITTNGWIDRRNNG